MSADTKPLMVTVREAQDILKLSSTKVYELAATGVLVKKYVGKGTRNFRLEYASLERYVAGLSQDPVEEAS